MLVHPARKRTAGAGHQLSVLEAIRFRCKRCIRGHEAARFKPGRIKRGNADGFFAALQLRFFRRDIHGRSGGLDRGDLKDHALGLIADDHRFDLGDFPGDDLQTGGKHHGRTIFFDDGVNTGDSLTNVENLLSIRCDPGCGLPESLTEFHFFRIFGESNRVGYRKRTGFVGDK